MIYDKMNPIIDMCIYIAYDDMIHYVPSIGYIQQWDIYNDP